MSTQHRHFDPGKIHIPYNWLYADETAREAETDVVAADVGKLARQEDDNSLWMLIDESPVTWLQIGGGGIDSGTSFPGSPSTNDLFFRTDRGISYYYDGTRWLSEQIFRDSFNNNQTAMPSSTNGALAGAWPCTQGHNGIYVLAVEAVVLVETTNDGSNYWTVNFDWRTQANANTNLTSFNTSADTPTNWYDKSVAVNAVLNSTARFLHAICNKTGSPGNIYLHPCIKYRLIG